MRIKSILKTAICSLLLTFLSIIPASAGNIVDLDNPAIIEAFMDGLIEPLMASKNSPAGTVSIMKDGKMIFSKGYGYQNIDDKTLVDVNKTLFRPGSVSKLFTWVAVMQMVEQGKLDLDADINTYLKTFQYDDTYPGDPVTMRHIMTHTPGFEDGGLGYLIIEDPERVLPINESLDKYRVARINPPGAQTSYSNHGAATAGLVVENISGVPFNNYIKQFIFEPLGMASSSFHEPLPENLIDDMETTYTYAAGQYKEKPFELVGGFGPAGSMSGTSPDLVKFAQAILNGGELNGVRILSEKTTKEMLTRNFTHDDRMMGMALGFYETEQNGIRLLGHGGDTGAFHSDLSIDHENNIVIFASFASEGGAAVRSAIVTSFYNQFFPREQVLLTGPSDFTARSAEYAGTYFFWRASHTKFMKAFGLTGGVNVVPTENNSLIIVMGENGSEYVEIEKDLFIRTDGSTKLAFQRNEAGEVSGMYMDGLPFMSMYKIGLEYNTGFNMMMLALSMIMFVAVILRRMYQGEIYSSLQGGNKRATKASIIVAWANVACIGLGLVVLTLVSDRLGTEIPMLFSLWNWLPIIAMLAGFYHIYNAVLVWKNGLLDGNFSRVRYTFVAGGSLFMCWFYYFWNIAGFKYYS
ncbi:MAG: serine hydrolase domain-containing protein [Sphingomonadales bacterium]